MIRTREEALALLRKRIDESGLSTTRFAEDVLWRQPRTVRRWINDESPIPRLVLDKLESPRVAPWPPPTLADVGLEEVDGEIVEVLAGVGS